MGLLDQLITVLTRPHSTLPDSIEFWEFALPILRSQGLLGRLDALASVDRKHLPQTALDYLEAGRVIAEHHGRRMDYEIERAAEALDLLGNAAILLKGASYRALGIPPAQGRVASDLDIMVPRDALSEAERLLVLAGWEHVQLDPYDQRYFRTWMHEIPPLQHRLRGTFLDLHHTIVPPTSRFRLGPDHLFAKAIEVPGLSLKALSPHDMIIHSASHLFSQGEFDHALRDLLDINDLATHLGSTSQFWEKLGDRASELDLARPTHYALRYAHRLLNTDTKSNLDEGHPSRPIQAFMDIVFPLALLPNQRNDRLAIQISEFFLYCRAHTLRMPPHLLIPHLMRKAMTPLLPSLLNPKVEQTTYQQDM